MSILSTLSGAQLLNEYNVRAVAVGKPILSSVKLSKVKLIERIEALPAPAGDDKPMTIAEFMRAHNVNPKVGRAALRRAGFNAPYDMTDADVMAVVNKLAGL